MIFASMLRLETRDVYSHQLVKLTGPHSYNKSNTSLLRSHSFRLYILFAARGRVSILLPLQTGHENMSRYFDKCGLNTEAHQKHELHMMKKNFLSSYLAAATIV